ncbi:hypothetical protein NAI87_05860 [Clavibacter michiganensis subsp. michiganensis]|uniref:hypothetical protein n=1 Tax=Clavibacter michiganensis TaxID=28447 RepID=UPI00345C02C2
MADVKDAQELLGLGHLVDVRVLRFGSALKAEPDEGLDDDAVDTSVKVNIVNHPGVLQVTMDMEVHTRGADYTVVGATQFHFDSAYELSEEVAREFAERVGVMAIYPYLREAIQSFSTRLTQTPITLPLLGQGQIDLKADNSAGDES